jgi:hypothetical protein
MMTVDTKEIVKLTAQLTSVHRAAFPNTVRFTLSDLAFDVKKNTLLPALSQSEMIIRSPQFFKRYSGARKAIGWDINAMQSQVGMMPSGGVTKAVTRLKQQEEGGTLPDRSFIPDIKVRTGANQRGRVRRSGYMNRLSLVGHISRGNKPGLIRTVTGTRISGGGSGKGNVIIYGSVLYEIQGFKRIRQSDTIKLHLKKLYAYRKDREIHLKPQRFMQRSALQSGQKLQELLNRNAERQLKKFLNR